MKHECPETPRLIRLLRQSGQVGPYERHLDKCTVCSEALRIHHLLRLYSPPEMPLQLRHMSGIRWHILVREQEKKLEKAALPLKMVSGLFIFFMITFFSIGGTLAILRFYGKINASIASLFGPILKSNPFGHTPTILMAAAGVFIVTFMILLTEFVTSD